MPTLMEKFDARYDEDITHPKTINKEDIQKEMSLKTFCDKYEVQWKKGEEAHSYHLHVSNRMYRTRQILHPIRLNPHLDVKSLNPKSPKFAQNCKYLCLWLTPCRKIQEELMPQDANMTAEEVAEYWKEMYYNGHTIKRDEVDVTIPGVIQLPNLPRWVMAMHYKYHSVNDSASESEEDEHPFQSHTAVEHAKGQESSSDDTSEDEMDDDPRVKRSKNPWYQDPNDVVHDRDMDEPDNLFDQCPGIEQMSNPEGENWMKWTLSNRLPPYGDIIQKFIELKNKPARPDKVVQVQLNHKQQLLRDIILDYARAWHKAYTYKSQYPEPLRLMVIGGPGTGKSTVIKQVMYELDSIFGEDFRQHLVKQGTPTGAASYQLSDQATTIHRLFGITINPNEDVLKPEKVAQLIETFKKGLCLLVIDEFSMVSRAMIGTVVDRLRQAQVNLNQMGIIFIGDPAQLLPIGGEPCWSIQRQKVTGRAFSKESYQGLMEFRNLFDMPHLENIPNYNAWQINSKAKKPTEAERKQIAQFTLDALQGNYLAVYLDDVRRTIANDQQSEDMVKHLIPRSKFGKTTERDIIRLQDMFATIVDVEKDPEFGKANLIQGCHYFSPDDPTRRNVESENVKIVFELGKLYEQPIVHLQSIHMPLQNSVRLSEISGKNFEGLHKHFLACKNVPLMLLTNYAPQFGLFNGATCYFKGLAYLDDEPDVTLKISDFKMMKFQDLKLIEPFDLNISITTYKQFHQLPVGSILKTINGVSVMSQEHINVLIGDNQSIKCVFHSPKCPPNLPDFIIVQSEAYKDRGGPNIFGFAGAEDLVPIPLTKIRYKPTISTNKSKSIFGYRIGFKVEPAIAQTPYKVQGKTLTRLKMEIKNHVKIPGLWYVSISRTKHPKHNHIPEDQWPNAMDIQLQRLNPSVIEAEIFEMAVQIQSAKTIRKYSRGKGNIYGECWSKEECDVADMVVAAYKNKHKTSIASIMSFIRKTFSTNVRQKLLQRVIQKMDNTYESLLKEEVPYLKDDEHKLLSEYKKRSGKSSKTIQ